MSKIKEALSRTDHLSPFTAIKPPELIRLRHRKAKIEVRVSILGILSTKVDFFGLRILLFPATLRIENLPDRHPLFQPLPHLLRFAHFLRFHSTQLDWFSGENGLKLFQVPLLGLVVAFVDLRSDIRDFDPPTTLL